IILTLIITMVLYIGVALVAVSTVGADSLSQSAQDSAAPLEAAARTFDFPVTAPVIAVGAVTAMLGVLLNLILGLSRVLLAMGRRRDMPPVTARLNTQGTTPSVAVLVMGMVIGLLVLVGSVKTTWSFSAFNVLLYYALTNLAALRLPERLYPRWISLVGLLSCIFLAFWVEPVIWIIGLVIIGMGFIWQETAQRIFT
ncbi:MAG: amino acid permease, partial [Anaerolineae bacterium]|nr:amino acid permease [Anaerolineae bacterium]